MNGRNKFKLKSYFIYGIIGSLLGYIFGYFFFRTEIIFSILFGLIGLASVGFSMTLFDYMKCKEQKIKELQNSGAKK